MHCRRSRRSSSRESRLRKWQDATDFTSADSETFGWRGTKTGKTLEATWKWDAASKTYKGTQKSAPATKKSAPVKQVVEETEEPATEAKGDGDDGEAATKKELVSDDEPPDVFEN